jgi:hypothetical protein
MPDQIASAIIAASAAIGGIVATQLVNWLIELSKRKREDALRFADRRREAYAAFCAAAESARRRNNYNPSQDEMYDACLTLGMEIVIMRPALEQLMWDVVKAKPGSIGKFMEAAKQDLIMAVK